MIGRMLRGKAVYLANSVWVDDDSWRMGMWFIFQRALDVKE